MMTYSDENKILLSCNKGTSGKVIVSDGVEIIASKAFMDCCEITEIILPDTLSEIKPRAFANCISLEKIIIPESVKEIPVGCFAGCLNLHTIILPSQLIKINSEAFINCRSLVNILLPSSLKKLGNSTFKYCISLRKILIPDGIKKIESDTFAECESLIEIDIPSSIRSIDCDAFKNCSELGYVIIESNNISIDVTAFLGCEHLTRVYLNNFTPIQVLSAFPDCSNIKYIAPLKDYSTGLSSEAVLLSSIQNQFSAELKYMSLYYRLFDMNITQMKWSECPKRNCKSFKEPIDTDWEIYKIEPQSLDYLLSLNWDKSSGIGLVLGYNQYRALDFDISSNLDFDFKYHKDGLNGYINEILSLLHLPLDYEWVVRSGNGAGFHIIFKSEDNTATQNIDSLSFEPNDECPFAEDRGLIRIELRWCDHLVLPPSLHASGLQYRFRKETLPTKRPSQVSLSDLDTMINKYCGERNYIRVTYNEIKFELTEINKIKCRHDSYLSPHEHQINSLNWLEEIPTDENINSLALCYLLGKEVEKNRDLAIKYLKESNSQSAKFNLLQLYACGYIKYEAKDCKELTGLIDPNLFGEHWDILKKNLNKYLPEVEQYMFIDTETTGLPNNYNAPSSDVNNWPRVIQLSWIITDQFQNILFKHNHIIKPNGYTIPEESSSIHGITTEYAQIHGEDLNLVLNLFESDIKNVKYVIGHNIDFDKRIIEAEFYRCNRVLSWNGTKSICTMKQSINFCGLQNMYGYRYPKLQELYYKLFGTYFENAHDAFNDILATEKCFWEMVKRNIIILPRTNGNSVNNEEDDELPF